MNNFDFFRYYPVMQVNGQSGFKTSIGGVLSIITGILSVLAIIMFSKDLIFKTNPTFLTTSNYTLYPTLKADKILVGLTAVFLNNTEIDDRDKLLNITFGKIVVNNSEENNINFYRINSVNCVQNIKSFQNNTNLEEMIIEDINNYMCAPEILKSDLIGEYATNSYSAWDIKIDKCRNSTENNNFCKSNEEIENVLSVFYGKLVFSDNIVQIDNLHFPIKEVYKKGVVRLSITSSRTDKFYFQITNVLSDEGILFEEEKSIMSYSFNRQETDSIIASNEDIILRLIITLTRNEVILKRTYKKIQKVAADVGGIIKALTIVFYVLNEVFGHVSFLRHLKKEYSLIEEERLKKINNTNSKFNTRNIVVNNHSIIKNSSKSVNNNKSMSDNINKLNINYNNSDVNCSYSKIDGNESNNMFSNKEVPIKDNNLDNKINYENTFNALMKNKQYQYHSKSVNNQFINNINNSNSRNSFINRSTDFIVLFNNIKNKSNYKPSSFVNNREHQLNFCSNNNNNTNVKNINVNLYNSFDARQNYNNTSCFAKPTQIDYVNRNQLIPDNIVENNPSINIHDKDDNSQFQIQLNRRTSGLNIKLVDNLKEENSINLNDSYFNTSKAYSDIECNHVNKHCKNNNILTLNENNYSNNNSNYNNTLKEINNKLSSLNNINISNLDINNMNNSSVKIISNTDNNKQESLKASNLSSSKIKANMNDNNNYNICNNINNSSNPVKINYNQKLFKQKSINLYNILDKFNFNTNICAESMQKENFLQLLQKKTNILKDCFYYYFFKNHYNSIILNQIRKIFNSEYRVENFINIYEEHEILKLKLIDDVDLFQTFCYENHLFRLATGDKIYDKEDKFIEYLKMIN